MTRTQASRARTSTICYVAFVRAAVKRWDSRKPHKAKAGEKLTRAITESRAIGEQGAMAGNNFVMIQRQKLIDGHADKEAVSLLYGWIGNMMTAMCLRYKRGNRTMRLGIRAMSKGRKALRAAYRRLGKSMARLVLQRPRKTISR